MTKVLFTLLNTNNPDPRAPKQAKTLIEAGYDAKIIACRSDGSLPKDGSNLGVPVHRVDMFYTWKKIPFIQYWDFYRKAWKVIEKERPDIVFCCDLNTLYLGIKAKKLLGSKILYDAREYFPGMIRGDAKFGSLFYKFYEKYEARWAPQCDAIITVNDEIRKILNKEYGVDSEVIMNCPPKSFLKRYRIHDEKVVGYVGDINWVRGVDKLAMAAKHVVESDPGFRFLIVGSGSYLPNVLDIVKKNGMEKYFEFTGQVPMDRMPSYYERMSVGTILFQPTINNMLGSPNKFFEFMGAGKAQLVSDFPVMGKIVREENCGDVVDPADPKKIAEKLLEMFLKRKVKPYGRNGRDAFEKKYNWEAQGKKMLKIIGQLAS